MLADHFLQDITTLIHKGLCVVVISIRSSLPQPPHSTFCRMLLCLLHLAQCSSTEGPKLMCSGTAYCGIQTSQVCIPCGEKTRTAGTCSTYVPEDATHKQSKLLDEISYDS
jgi:hypothetical protein